jgi:hypothetical protein
VASTVIYKKLLRFDVVVRGEKKNFKIYFLSKLRTNLHARRRRQYASSISGAQESSQG